tara:strand:- start:110 stop:325 length:216 start_codon:yes stop_codon:yes gene_type:complete
MDFWPALPSPGYVKPQIIMVSIKACAGLNMRQKYADNYLGLCLGAGPALQATANMAYNSVFPFSIEKISYF